MMGSHSRETGSHQTFLRHGGVLSLSHPVRSLTIFFLLWKALLFLVIVACPGPGYDTSTALLPTGAASATTGERPSSIPLRFVRWDSIYFVHIAENGYVFEQEWAFGYGYTRLLTALVSVFYQSGQSVDWVTIALIGVAVSHIAHYLSILSLYRLSINIFGEETTAKKLICFLSAALHVICPAGAFLSAPNGEAVFSFLNFYGFYVYSSSLLSGYDGNRIIRDIKLLTAAVIFAAATTVRSNGILSGFLFAYDAFLQLWKIGSQGLSLDGCVHLSVIIIGGCIVALGIIFPQFIAYMTHCTSHAVSRPWCQWTLPSIYAWVQNKYWNVGFLRYWTVSNLPLFLLAMPVLTVLCQSSLWGLRVPFNGKDGISAILGPPRKATGSMLVRLAVTQGLLAVMAFTSYHVQIVNRISSGYPLWYWYLVSLTFGHIGESAHNTRRSRAFAIAVQAMVAYGLIQGVLFGSFLPPA